MCPCFDLTNSASYGANAGGAPAGWKRGLALYLLEMKVVVVHLKDQVGYLVELFLNRR